MSIVHRGSGLAVLLLLAWSRPSAAAISLPQDFVVDDLVPGVTFTAPTAVAFLPGGRMLVAEKAGMVWAVDHGVRNATPLWDRQNEVLNVSDRGLLGIAVDPNYVDNHYVYFLYTVDPDSNGTDNNNDAFGRLTRYQVSFSDSNAVDPNSRTILLGVDWRHGPPSGSPSHTIGSLRFAADGSLMVSAGDGAQYNSADAGGLDPGLFGPNKTDPYEDIGAFRSQYIGSLAGKILRINPANGHGYASNPYTDGNLASNQSKVWAYGLRNPFRFNLRPGTGVADTSLGQPGTLYIGDVGWDTWEEMDVAAQGGLNFGWPCYEGAGPQSTYQSLTPAHHDCSTIGTSVNPAPVTGPISTWNHNNASLSIPPGFTGNTSIGGVFYTSTLYPSVYRNQYFFADYGQDWIKVAIVNASNQLVQVLGFATGAGGCVDLEAEPGTGNLVYPAILTGKIRRIRFTGVAGNNPPIASASAAPLVGAAPLSVDFSSAGSGDPDNDPIQFTWNFGDATGSTSANPSHVYNTPGSYDAVLTVSDNNGGQASDTVHVEVVGSSGFPLTSVLDDFNRANGPIGGPWVDDTAGLAIQSNQLVETGGASTTVWTGATFGPDQEAFITFSSIVGTPSEQDLMLKVQGLTWSSGHIEVRYAAGQSLITIDTYDPSAGWIQRGQISPITFTSGDQMGARAYGNGIVQVYKNGAAIGSASVAAWAHAADGGHVGLTIDAQSSHFDNFGGGSITLNSNTPPTAGILSPVNGAFFVTGDTIRLNGQVSDAQDPSGALQVHWEMDVHHNNHIHPSSFVSNQLQDYFIAENHDDGTGIFFEIQLQVTDTGGLADTARVFIYPEIDLRPSTLVTAPSTPGSTAPAKYHFELHNDGRMPAPISHWQLVADGSTLAQGDTLVAALDSVLVTRTLPPTLSVATHTLRVAVDTLGTVVETNEANNGLARPLTVVNGPGPDEVPPAFVAGPSIQAADDAVTLQWSNDEVTSATVHVGRTRAASDTTVHKSLLLADHVLSIEGLLDNTLYYDLVTATDAAGNFTTAPLDSFTTTQGSTAVGGDPVGRLELSAGMPNPSTADIAFALALPQHANVSFGVYDLLGRDVWHAAARTYDAGRWTLRWDGRSGEGTRVRAGVYLARVRVDGVTFTRRLAMLQ